MNALWHRARAQNPQQLGREAYACIICIYFGANFIIKHKKLRLRNNYKDELYDTCIAADAGGKRAEVYQRRAWSLIILVQLERTLLKNPDETGSDGGFQKILPSKSSCLVNVNKLRKISLDK